METLIIKMSNILDTTQLDNLLLKIQLGSYLKLLNKFRVRYSSGKFTYAICILEFDYLEYLMMVLHC